MRRQRWFLKKTLKSMARNFLLLLPCISSPSAAVSWSFLRERLLSRRQSPWKRLSPGSLPVNQYLCGWPLFTERRGPRFLSCNTGGRAVQGRALHPAAPCRSLHLINCLSPPWCDWRGQGRCFPRKSEWGAERERRGEKRWVQEGNGTRVNKAA